MANLNSTIINGNLEINGNLVSKNKVFLDLFYPVGSIFMSVSRNESTATTAGKYGCPLADNLGGEWEVIPYGNFLLGATDSDTVNGITSTGSKYITITTDNLPEHNHSFTPQGTISASYSTSSLTIESTAPTFTGTSVTTSTAGAHKHNFTVLTMHSERDQSDSGSSWFIKQGGSGDSILPEESDVNVNHTHTISNSNTFSVNSGSHTHTISNPEANITNCTFTGNTGNTGSKGSGRSINIMNPYYAVYMWRRTA